MRLLRGRVTVDDDDGDDGVGEKRQVRGKGSKNGQRGMTTLGLRAKGLMRPHGPGTARYLVAGYPRWLGCMPLTASICLGPTIPG